MSTSREADPRAAWARSLELPLRRAHRDRARSSEARRTGAVRRKFARTFGGRKVCGLDSDLPARKGLQAAGCAAVSLHAQRALSSRCFSDRAALDPLARTHSLAADRACGRDSNTHAQWRSRQAEERHWTFVARRRCRRCRRRFVFAADRSGKTPRHVLAGTHGTLLVDAYSGYNSVAVKARAPVICVAPFLAVLSRIAAPCTRCGDRSTSRYSEGELQNRASLRLRCSSTLQVISAPNAPSCIRA
jgi:hypothetical protein